MNILITTASFGNHPFPASWNVIFNPHGRKLTEPEIGQMVEEYQPVGIIAGVEPLTRQVMLKSGSLKVISRSGIGLDSVDIEAANELGITVVNTPDAPTVSVAELTIGLMLCIIRRINTMDANIKKGIWKGMPGMLMKGKTVGIIGCGRIGTQVARLVTAFGCNTLGYDPLVQKHEICKMTSLDEILVNADIITLHIPYSKENRHLIGARELKRMKSSSLLINAARGGIVDESALFDALVSGTISGAALDCFETEPYSGPLTQLENVLFTSHTGSDAIESKTNMERQALNNLVMALAKHGLE